MSKRTVSLILIAIILVSVVTRLYGLDRQSLWYDEAVEAIDFQVLLNKILYNGEKTPDIRPPLNPFFVYLITKIFPDSDFALRIPALIFGAISIPLLYLLGRRLFNEKVGLIASFLLAISPFHIWYSQDARMYALLWMLSLISLIFFLRALERPNFSNFAGYCMSTEAALYTHQFAVFLILLQGLYLLLSLQRFKAHILKWFGIFSLLVIVYLPWLIYSFTELMHIAAGAFYKPIDIKTFLYSIYTYCAGFSIGPSIREIKFDMSLNVVKPYVPLIGSLMAVYCSLFITGIVSMRKDYAKLLLPLLILTVPVIGVYIIVLVKPDVAYNVRYTATALFAFLLFVAKGVDRLSCIKPKTAGKIAAIIALLIITGFSSYSYSNYQFDIRYHKDDIRGAVAYIMENKMPDDGIVIFGDPGKVFERYLRGSIPYNRLLDISLISRESLEHELREKVEGKGRLWIVHLQDWNVNVSQSANYAMSWLNTYYEELPQLRKGITDIANMRVYCYDLIKKTVVKQ